MINLNNKMHYKITTREPMTHTNILTTIHRPATLPAKTKTTSMIHSRFATNFPKKTH